MKSEKPEPDPDELVVLCNLVENGPSGVYGSAQEVCSACQRKVWLSPATRATAERTDPNYKILCLPCGEERMSGSPDEKLLPPSVEQLREFLKVRSELN